MENFEWPAAPAEFLGPDEDASPAEPGYFVLAFPAPDPVTELSKDEVLGRTLHLPVVEWRARDGKLQAMVEEEFDLPIHAQGFLYPDGVVRMNYGTRLMSIEYWAWAVCELFRVDPKSAYEAERRITISIYGVVRAD